MNDALTPKAVVAALDAHIIGQDEAKRAVAVALRNRWRRQRLRSATATARFASFWPMICSSRAATTALGVRASFIQAVFREIGREGEGIILC